MLARLPWRPVKPRHRWILVGILAGAVLLGVGGYLSLGKEVTIHVDGQTIFVKTRHITVGGALRHAGVTIGEYDLVQPGMRERLARNSVVWITRALPVKFYYDGVERVAMVPIPTVASVLQQQGIYLGPEDRMETNLSPAGQEEMYVRISRTRRATFVERVEVPFKTWYREDRHLPQGTRKVVREGVPGLMEQRVTVIWQDGREVERRVLSAAQVRAPQAKIVAVGSGTVPQLASRGGEHQPGRREFVLVATGYTQSAEEGTADGITATGTRVRPGVAAVDPQVIPLGTTLWVEGYGYARAEDTGGAIKGNRIDLFFDTKAEAHQWGRRTVKAYIVD